MATKFMSELRHKQQPVVVDIFSGAGGLSEGFLNAGFAVRLALDSDNWATATQRTNHASRGVDVIAADLASSATYRQIKDRLALMQEPVTLLIGGPPCQGFSTSNAQTRANGNPHNANVFTFVKYVRRLRPAIFLMENVTGLDFFDDGKLKESILRMFRANGYVVDVMVLNAAEYGVPQTRSRIFFIGNRLGIINFFPPPQVTKDRWVTVWEAISDLPPKGQLIEDRPLPYAAVRPSDYAKKIRTNASRVVTNNLRSTNSQLILERFRHIPQGGNWSDIPDRLMGNYSDKSRCHRVIYKRLSPNRPAAAMPHVRKSMVIHPFADRGLTVREAARLQSFPDNFTFKGGIQSQQQQVANAVPPLLATALASTIMSKMIRTTTRTARLSRMAPDLLPNVRYRKISARYTESIPYFRGRLSSWARNNLRDLPWRNTADPYRILVAEILLQKTTTNQARQAYEELINKYPTVEALSCADIGSLRKMLAATGLPNRATRLKRIGQVLIREFHGIIPRDRVHLASLPGVGSYISSAIACFAYGQRVPLVDSNVIRIFSRFFGVNSKNPRPRNDPLLWRFAAEVVPSHNPIMYHQALLDLSAIVCTDRRPKCDICPLRARCRSYNCH